MARTDAHQSPDEKATFANCAQDSPPVRSLYAHEKPLIGETWAWYHAIARTEV